MPRDLPLGNGAMLVNFDLWYQLRDVYFPHVGHQNQTLGNPSRVGVWSEGRFAWLSDWQLDRRYRPDTLVTDIRGEHTGLGLRLAAADAVDHSENILVRRFAFTDTTGRARRLRLFVHLDPYLGEAAYSNAAYYDAGLEALVFYREDTYLLLGARPAMRGYSVGVKGAPGLDGTWRDSEDGQLSGNAIGSGSVDGTLMVEVDLPAHGEAIVRVWLAAGTTLGEVARLHDLANTGFDELIGRTERYWRYWLVPSRRDFGDLSERAAELYRRSLLIVRTQTDNNGAIVAANDTDIVSFGRDHYSYVWPRDAALVADTLDEAGYHEAPRQFYRFLAGLLEHANYAMNGYLLHRYTPTGRVAASWHPGVGDGRMQFPIQEDETALVVWSLCRHVIRTGSVELMGTLYRDFVRPAADFMLLYRDFNSGLPRPSNDLWEEKHGVFLFTCASVHAALEAAADVADLLEETGTADQYRSGAAEVREGVARHMVDPVRGRFVFMLRVLSDGRYERDDLLDSSMAGVFLFGLFPADDPRVVATMRALERGLVNRGPIGGVARRADDYYHHTSGDFRDYPGNAWFVSTLWLADWMSDTGDFAGAREWIEWCARRALPSGVLAEQLHPQTGAPLSVSPLTWSHAAFIASVDRYARRFLGQGGQSMGRVSRARA